MLNGDNPKIKDLIRQRVVDLKAVRTEHRTAAEARLMMLAMREAINAMVVNVRCLPQERFITTTEWEAVNHLIEYACLKTEVARDRIERDLCRTFKLQDWDELSGDQYVPALALIRGYLET